MKIKYLLFIAFFITIFDNVIAQTEKMESVFIYNFISKYIEWPAADKSGDFTIGVLGGSPIVEEFNSLAATKKVGSQSITVKKFASAGEIAKCHVLYIPASKKGQLSDALSKVGGNSTLIVTSFDGGAKSGAAINFITVDDKMKFELNQENAKKQSLKVADALVQLAIIVK